MADRNLTWQIVIILATTLLAVVIAVPMLARVPLEYALPLLLSGMLFGMSVMRAEIAVRRRPRR
jgi:prepilin signal peptidase PulO-like enzyme (type II secretory pathway)